jgi:secreted protein with Ig-like and vWFA domain
MESLQGHSSSTPQFLIGPTQVPPERDRIWLQEERDPITQNVTVTYQGGKGGMAVREVLVRLTRSDGQVLVQTFRPQTVGEGAVLQGTRYADRLEVVVMYNNGESYTVIDRIFPYKERN